MGLMDMLSQQFSNISNEISNAKKGYNERTSMQKPGDWCTKLCMPGENCRECTNARRLFEEGLKELEMLEDYADSSPEEIKRLMAERPVKCSLCGAPIENGEAACPYCDTEYPEGMVTIDIPVSKAERKNAMLGKAEEAWGHYIEQTMIASKNVKEHPAEGILGKLSGLAMGVLESTSIMKQDSSQIKQMADKYGVSLSAYLKGAAAGSYQTFAGDQLEEASRRMQEQSARSRQIEAERQAKVSAIQNENYQWQLNMINHRSYGYSGGADRYCGNCRYFWGGNNCTNGGHTSGASDYCGCWALK